MTISIKVSTVIIVKSENKCISGLCLAQMVENFPAMQGNSRFRPGSGKFPGEVNDNPL